jgi:hypothetical protein
MKDEASRNMDLYRTLLSVWPVNPLRPVKKGFAKEGLACGCIFFHGFKRWIEL